VGTNPGLIYRCQKGITNYGIAVEPSNCAARWLLDSHMSRRHLAGSVSRPAIFLKFQGRNYELSLLGQA